MTPWSDYSFYVGLTLGAAVVGVFWIASILPTPDEIDAKTKIK